MRRSPCTGAPSRRPAAAATGLLTMVLAALWLAPAPSGLSREGLHALVLLLASLAIGLLGWLPEYVGGLLMLALWVVGGVVRARVAASGYASPTWFLLF